MDFKTPRNATRRVHVGKVAVGGGAPVSVQSMTNVPMIDGPDGPWLDVEGNLAQIGRLASAGCEIVRVAIPNRASIARFGQVAEASPLPSLPMCISIIRLRWELVMSMRRVCASIRATSVP